MRDRTPTCLPVSLPRQGGGVEVARVRTPTTVTNGAGGEGRWYGGGEGEANSQHHAMVVGAESLEAQMKRRKEGRTRGTGKARQGGRQVQGGWGHLFFLLLGCRA